MAEMGTGGGAWNGERRRRRMELSERESRSGTFSRVFTNIVASHSLSFHRA